MRAPKVCSLLAAIPLCAMLAAQPALPAGAAMVAAIRSAPALHVSGTHIEDAGNTPVQLNGVDRSGTEYACIRAGASSTGRTMRRAWPSWPRGTSTSCASRSTRTAG